MVHSPQTPELPAKLDIVVVYSLRILRTSAFKMIIGSYVDCKQYCLQWNECELHDEMECMNKMNGMIIPNARKNLEI